MYLFFSFFYYIRHKFTYFILKSFSIFVSFFLSAILTKCLKTETFKIRKKFPVNNNSIILHITIK